MCEIIKIQGPKSDADGYCPYCNTKTGEKLSLEHVIPQLIGGTNETMIYACIKCNTTAGAQIDTLFQGQSTIGLRNVRSKDIPRRFGNRARLRMPNGKELVGNFFAEHVGDQIILGFEPDRRHPDGEIWIHEKSSKRNTVLKGVNVYKVSPEHQITIAIDDPVKIGPAVAKIICGFADIFYGKHVVSDPEFDVLRNAIKTKSMKGVDVNFVTRDQLNRTDMIGAPLPPSTHDVVCIVDLDFQIQGRIMFGGTTFCALVNFGSKDREFRLSPKRWNGPFGEFSRQQ